MDFTNSKDSLIMLLTEIKTCHICNQFSIQGPNTILLIVASSW